MNEDFSDLPPEQKPHQAPKQPAVPEDWISLEQVTAFMQDLWPEAMQEISSKHPQLDIPELQNAPEHSLCILVNSAVTLALTNKYKLPALTYTLFVGELYPKDKHVFPNNWKFHSVTIAKTPAGFMAIDMTNSQSENEGQRPFIALAETLEELSTQLNHRFIQPDNPTADFDLTFSDDAAAKLEKDTLFVPNKLKKIESIIEALGPTNFNLGDIIEKVPTEPEVADGTILGEFLRNTTNIPRGRWPGSKTTFRPLGITYELLPPGITELSSFPEHRIDHTYPHA